MATNFPSSLDTSTQQPTIAASDEMDDSGKEHDVVHTNHSGAIIALETKLGTGDSNAVADAVLMGTGSGTSAWDTSPTFKGALTVGENDTGHDVIFYGATGSAKLFWDESADTLYAENSQMYIWEDSSSAVFNIASHHDDESSTPLIQFLKSDGSHASPALVDDNASLGRMDFYGYDGDSYALGARIHVRADGTPSSSSMPTEMVFEVTPVGSQSPVTALTIQPNGNCLFTADSDLTDFTSDDIGVISLMNTDNAVDDFTCLDFWGNTTNGPNARIAMKYTSSGSQLHFGTSNDYSAGITNTAMVINRHGYVGIGTTLGDDMPSNDGTLSVKSSNAPVFAVYRVNSISSNVNSWFISDYSATGTIHAKIYNDGDIQNTNNSYGSLSDERLKVVSAARDYYEDLRKLEVVNYQFTKKTEQVVTTNSDGEETITYQIVDRDTPTIKCLGLVAQQAEQHIAGLVREGDDGMKELKYSVLTPMLLQAFQKLADKVEALEG
jgi:hypothetical protein